MRLPGPTSPAECSRRRSVSRSPPIQMPSPSPRRGDLVPDPRSTGTMPQWPSHIRSSDVGRMSVRCQQVDGAADVDAFPLSWSSSFRGASCARGEVRTSCGEFPVSRRRTLRKSDSVPRGICRCFYRPARAIRRHSACRSRSGCPAAARTVGRERVPRGARAHLARRRGL